eukprot:CAMPEP_0119063518 /NCGR_PEP_ID=MMETSP1178-20130426/6840_1 /TAXON_ID=33656 /ORGANISM="unid sp, Strain CCMP2000" /LENGTH=93 /DNA_ID=CAMNT_0007044889 /DNA_START=259 /DNA_END=537 /DNA_ORIENTATION=+
MTGAITGTGSTSTVTATTGAGRCHLGVPLTPGGDDDRLRGGPRGDAKCATHALVDGELDARHDACHHKPRPKPRVGATHSEARQIAQLRGEAL